MFCPSCGTEYTIGLPYCNRCGANLGAALAEPEPVAISLTKPILIIGAVITLLTLGGFGLIIGGAVELAHTAQMGSDPVIAMVVMGMLIVLTADIFLVRQLAKMIDASLKSGPPKRSKPAMPPVTASRLPPLATAQLSSGPSVTENTTRFLESSYRAPSETDDRATIQKIER